LELTSWWRASNVITKNFYIYQVEPENGELKKSQNTANHRRKILSKGLFYISGCYENNVECDGNDVDNGNGIKTSTKEVLIKFLIFKQNYK
jgi:hypothetical protein